MKVFTLALSALATTSTRAEWFSSSVSATTRTDPAEGSFSRRVQNFVSSLNPWAEEEKALSPVERVVDFVDQNKAAVGVTLLTGAAAAALGLRACRSRNDATPEDRGPKATVAMEEVEQIGQQQQVREELTANTDSPSSTASAPVSSSVEEASSTSGSASGRNTPSTGVKSAGDAAGNSNKVLRDDNTNVESSSNNSSQASSGRSTPVTSASAHVESETEREARLEAEAIMYRAKLQQIWESDYGKYDFGPFNKLNRTNLTTHGLEGSTDWRRDYQFEFQIYNRGAIQVTLVPAAKAGFFELTTKEGDAGEMVVEIELMKDESGQYMPNVQFEYGGVTYTVTNCLDLNLINSVLKVPRCPDRWVVSRHRDTSQDHLEAPQLTVAENLERKSKGQEKTQVINPLVGGGGGFGIRAPELDTNVIASKLPEWDTSGDYAEASLPSCSGFAKITMKPTTTRGEFTLDIVEGTDPNFSPITFQTDIHQVDDNDRGEYVGSINFQYNGQEFTLERTRDWLSREVEFIIRNDQTKATEKSENMFCCGGDGEW